jgi:hypothetical protein
MKTSIVARADAQATLDGIEIFLVLAINEKEFHRMSRIFMISEGMAFTKC